MRDIGTENQRMEVEISSLKLKIEDLNEAVRQGNMKQDTSSIALNCNLQVLLAENQKLVHDFKGKRFTDRRALEIWNYFINISLNKQIISALIFSFEFAHSSRAYFTIFPTVIRTKISENICYCFTTQFQIAFQFNNFFYSTVDCKRLEEMEQDFKRVSVKYHLLLRQKEQLGQRLPG